MTPLIDQTKSLKRLSEAPSRILSRHGLTEQWNTIIYRYLHVYYIYTYLSIIRFIYIYLYILYIIYTYNNLKYNKYNDNSKIIKGEEYQTQLNSDHKEILLIPHTSNPRKVLTKSRQAFYGAGTMSHRCPGKYFT